MQLASYARLIRRAAIVSAITLAMSCSSCIARKKAPDIPKDTSFTIAVIPDPQNYVSFDHQKNKGYPFDSVDQFFEQMRYVASNVKSAGGDIAFVTFLGDMWNHQTLLMDHAHKARGLKRVRHPILDKYFPPTSKTRSYEMPMSKQGVEIIAGKVPFSVVPGNHDYDAQWNDSRFPPTAKDITRPEDAGQIHTGGLTNFRTVYGAGTQFFKDQPWYVDSHDDGADSAQIFEAAGYRWLHIGLQFSPSDLSLAWAASVIVQYPGLPTIVSTHDHLDPSGQQLPAVANDQELVDPGDDNNPATVWRKFLSKQDQVFLVLSAHQPGQARRVDMNDFGHEVHQMLADYQDRHHTALAVGYEPAWPAGIGDGWMRLLRFDMDGKTPTIHVRTYSTHYKKFSSEMPEYAQWYRPHEQPNMADAEFLAAEDFTIELADFRRRFDLTAKLAH